MESEVKRKTLAYGIAAVLLASVLSAVCLNFGVIYEPHIPIITVPHLPGHPATEQTFLLRFSSYTELFSFLEPSLKTPQWEYYEVDAFGGSPPPQNAPKALTGALDYSQTNIQVEGVDEADIVKTDGIYLYIVSKNSLFILKAYPPEEAELLSRIDFNGTLGEIFVNGDKLVILGSFASYLYEPYYYEPSYYYYRPYAIDEKTIVKVYDISNRSNPWLTRDFSISGNYFDSRMIDEYVYVIASQSTYLLTVNENDTLVLPTIHSGDKIEEIGASDIYYANISDYSYAFTTVVAINVQNDTQEPTHETFLLGATSCMYVSINNIYLTFMKGGGTLIYRISIEDQMIKCEASGEVPGNVLNQFSMDEYNGYFRLATTDWTSQNNVYVLDMNLTVVGELENLAPGERIHSARFMGERCYLVTFKKVDPLFVISLEDPMNPEVLGYLKIPGYSDYLHPYDENHLIGIGKETVEAEGGDFAWYQGLKISLFDVSNFSNPVEIDKYEIGDRGTDSPVLVDHKALLFDKSKNLLVIPVLVAEIDPEKYPEGAPPYTYGDYVWQGAYVFNINLDKYEMGEEILKWTAFNITLDEVIELKGRITHLENGMDLWTSNYWVKRSLYIGNVLYTISDEKVMMHNLETLEEINQIEL